MIKKSYEIKVKDLILMEDSGSIRQFIRVPLPSILFVKAVKREIEKVLIQFESNRSTDFENGLALGELKHRLKLWIEVNQLSALDLLIRKELTHADLYTLKGTIRSRKLRKIVDRTPYLREAFAKVMEYTGIEINNGSDILAFRAHLEHTRDRLDQIERKIAEESKPKEGNEKASLVSIVNGVCMYLNISPVGIEEMTMVQFIDLYKKASAKHKAEIELIEKQKAHGNV